MSSSNNTCAASASGGSGALSLMGCVREASPPPQDHHVGMGEFAGARNADTLPKEPKKRRFHPLRGLRRIFRRKSRGAADARINSRNGERDGELPTRDREEVTLRHPAGVAEESRSRSASELLTDSCDRQSVFLRRSGIEESFAKLRVGSGQLSVSHDSVFPGEVPHTRPLSSLDTLATLERRQTKTSGEAVHKDYGSHAPYNHRISLRVLEQIKTAIESRNQLASSTPPESTHAPNATSERYQQETNENLFVRAEKYDRIDEEPEKFRVTRIQDVVERVTLTPKEDLPQLEIASLNHTAAHHRIAVRPKNRRPPRRPTTTTSSCSTITIISTSSDTLDSLEPMIPSASSSPVEPKMPSILRKSSSRLSRNCDIFEELESKLPRKPASLASLSPDSLDSTARTILDHSEPEESKEFKPVARKPSNRVSKGSDVFDELESRLPRRRSSNRLSKSPDSLENSLSKSTDGFDMDDVKPTINQTRKHDNSISKSTEAFDKISQSVEVRPMPRRLPNAISKSTEGFDKLIEHQEPIPVARRLLLPISKSSDVVSKSTDVISKFSDSLEVLEALTSDDSIERRRSSFEIRPRRGMKVMSMSSENFEALAQVQALQKRNSASDVNLFKGKRHCKVISKSSESFEVMETSGGENRASLELGKPGWRSSKRVSSESSDYFDEEKSERKIRRPKRVSSSTVIDIFSRGGCDGERAVTGRKPRVQKSSESSELGSTDTLDSERRNKSDSTETLDSLEKDGEHEVRDEEMNDEKRDKHDSWIKSESEPTNADNAGNEEPKSPEKNYWRQTSESKENIDIHQLLALTIVSRIADNGNNQRNNSVQFPKKKLASPPTSPIKQEDNKLLFNNLLSSKNDEDLQNMLNGNISEVSTDTKSFKEKLIMFEKLGK